MSGKHFSLIKSKEVEVMPDDVAWGVDAVRIGPRRLSLVVASLPDGTVRFFQVIATKQDFVWNHLNVRDAAATGAAAGGFLRLYDPHLLDHFHRYLPLKVQQSLQKGDGGYSLSLYIELSLTGRITSCVL